MIQSPKNTTVKGTVNQPGHAVKDEAARRAEQRRSYPANVLDRRVLQQRRNALSVMGLLPPHMEGKFWPAERVVMHIIGREIQDTNGAPFCEFYGNIQERAETSRITVIRALKKAMELGIITVCSGGKQRSGRSRPLTIFASEEWKAHLFGETCTPGEIKLYVAPAGDAP